MGRPRKFDQEQAVRQAMQLFWRNGYKATSVQALGEALNLNPGSLFNAFHDKHSLFMEALQCYRRTETEPVCRTLHHDESGLATIRRLFEDLIDDACDDDTNKGCLMVNAISELAAVDPAVREVTTSNQDLLLTGFRAALRRAQANQEIRADLDIDATASYLMNNMYGLRVMSKVDQDKAHLKRMLDVVLQGITQ